MTAGARRAATIVLAVAISYALVALVCAWCGARPAPAVVAAFLALGFGRRPAPRGAALAGAAATVAVIAPAAAAIGVLLHALPPAGAALFVAGMAGSVWLRNFGARERTAGALIALPFVAMLVVPGRAAAPGGLAVDLALFVAAGLVALAVSAAIAALAGDAPEGAGAAPPRAKRPGLSVPSRMALQMAVALSAAFAIGFGWFPAHWGWTVLSAYIVCGMARGRGDALYTGMLRLAGAAGGTVAAALLAAAGCAAGGPFEAVAIAGVLFAGLWLREISYAYWAASMTLVLALLAGTDGPATLALLGERLTAIFWGAASAIAAAWFVVPIRTEAVIRRRLADALAALDQLVAAAPEERAATAARFEGLMDELDGVAPPVYWHRRIFAYGDVNEHPARWIDLARGLRPPARALASGDAVPADGATLRRAIGRTRKAIAEHGKRDPDAPPSSISGALAAVKELFGASGT
jgi:hypothetical protein